MGKGKLKQALDLAGSQHKYQHVLLAILSVLWFIRTAIVLCGPYIYMDPMFHCTSKGTHPVHEKQACKIMNECQIIDDFTLTAHLELYCHLQWARITIQSIFPLGSFVGLMVINLVSDTKGRRTAILIDLVISIAGTMFALVGGNSNNVYCLILSQFLLGFGGYSILTLGYTILSDFFSDSFRQFGIVLMSALAGLSVFTIGIFYIMKLSWFYYLLYFIFIPLLAITGLFFLILYQSPFVLMNHNNQKAAQQVLIKIAIFNGQKQNVPQIKQIIEQEQRDHTHKPTLHKIYHMIKQWRFLKPIIILVIINGIGNLNYFGITFCFSQEGLGFGYNSMIFGFVQVISFVTTRYTVRYLQRKQGMMILYGCAMVISLSFQFQFIQESSLISSVLFGINRILSVNAYCLLVCVQTQAFSVYIQSTATGLIQGFALYGAIFAPMVVQTAQYLQIDPIFLIGLFLSFAIWPALFLEQTFHTPPILDQPKSSTVSLLNRSRQQIQRLPSQESHDKSFEMIEKKRQKQFSITQRLSKQNSYMKNKLSYKEILN